MRIVCFSSLETGKNSLNKIGICNEKGVWDISQGLFLFSRCQGKKVPLYTSVIDLMRDGCFKVSLFKQVLDFLKKYELEEQFLYQKFKLHAPLMPGKIIALGKNYAAHAREGGSPVPKEPIYFPKANSAVIGPEEPIVCDQSLERIDPEVELAVVIGRKATKVKEKEALEYVAGYTVLNDVTVRDMQARDIRNSEPWYRSKSLDTFCPIGPCIALPDEIKDPHNLKIQLRVNGELRQNSSTKELVFKIPPLISTISSLIT